MRIGIDVDSVLRDFTYGFNQLYNELISDPVSYPNEWAVDLNYEPEIFSLETCGKYRSEIVEKIRNIHFPEIMRESPIYLGAKEFLKTMFENFDCVLITHQYTDETKLATFDWLVKHELPYSCIFSKGEDKHQYCDLLIDDSLKNLAKMVEENKTGICFARNWNKEYQGLRTGDYNEVINFTKVWKQLQLMRPKQSEQQ